MGNSISLEENENENGGENMSPNQIAESDIQQDMQEMTTLKKSKRTSSDVVKKRRLTYKNSNTGALKKTKSVRRR